MEFCKCQKCLKIERFKKVVKSRMNSFKSFVKTVADKAQAEFPSPVKASTGATAAAANESAEGFICPMCMRGYADPSDLQSCFERCQSERDHADEGGGGANGSQDGTRRGSGMRDGVSGLRATLAEEQAHSAELAKQVERLTMQVSQQSQEGGLIDDEEKLMLQSQVEALQMGKDVMSRELESTRRTLSEAEDAVEAAKAEAARAEAKLASLTQENAALKTGLDQATSEARVSREKAAVLEAVLEQKNNSDDVQVLRNELQNVQQSMMGNIEEIKADTRLEELRSENARLLASIEAAHSETARIHEAKQKAESEVLSIRESLVQSEAESNALQAKNVEANKSLESTASQLSGALRETQSLRANLEAKESKLEDTEKSREAAMSRAEALQNENCDLKASLERQSNQLEETSRRKTDAEKETAACQESIEILKGELARTKEEREDLLSNIEAKEGINTAMQQLKVENESLGNQIKSLTREKGAVAESHKAEIEALFTSINEGKSKLAESNDKSSGLQAQLDDTTTKLHQSEQKVVKLEESVNSKSNEISELTSSNQHAVQNMKQLHQEELHKLNTSLAAKQSEIETANSRLGQLSSEIEVAKSANSDLKTSMERLKESHKEEQMKVESLTKELHHSKDTVKKVTSDLDSAKERFEAFKGHASRAEKEAEERERQLAERGEAYKAQIASLKEDISSFKDSASHQAKAVSDLEDSLATEKARSSELESSFEELKSKTAGEKADMEGTISSLQESNTDLSALLESKSTQLNQLTEKSSALEQSVADLTEMLASTNFQLTKTGDKLTESEARYTKETKNMRETISDLESAKEILLNGKIELSNQLEEQQRSASKVMKQLEEAKNVASSMKVELEADIKRVRSEAAASEDRLRSEIGTLQSRTSELLDQVKTAEGEMEELRQADLRSQEQLALVNSQMETVLSEKLELEAKVGSSADEIRSLLERCLAAESELDRSRSSVVELRRKLDDSQAALHELGRENQSIQVELAKQTGRKWADDAEVNECAACKCGFSLTNRKHHCRNCGQIFCNDCSARQTMMANFKKAQRVCEPCYTELQTNGN